MIQGVKLHQIKDFIYGKARKSKEKQGKVRKSKEEVQDAVDRGIEKVYL